MAWDDDKSGVGATLTGTEWNAHRDYIKSIIATSGNLASTSVISLSTNITTSADVITDDILPNSSSSGVTIKNKNGSTVISAGAGSSSSTNVSMPGALAVTGNITQNGVQVATTTDTQTLTNKTLTSAIIASDLDFNGTDSKDMALATFKVYAIGNSSTAATVDWNNGAIQTITLTGNCTLTFTAPTVDSSNYARLMLIVTQGAGPYTLTYPASVKWKGGTAPTLTTTNGREDVLSFLFNGTNYAGVADLNFDL